MTKSGTLFNCKIKFIKNFKYILLLCLIVLSQSSSLSYLDATIYTTSILSHKENESIFLEAIKADNVKEVNALINSGCDVNESTTAGYTPLMTAVFKGNMDIINLLISNGADLEAFDNQGNTPFMYAFYGEKEKKQIVKALLALNVNIEVMNSQEQTPLILATLNNHFKSLSLLIEAGAKIEVKGKSGGTALMQAADHENIESAKILIQHGADLETRDDWTFTPLMIAAFRNNGSILRILIKAGADVNARTTKSIPISLKKDWNDFFPKTVYIPSGSTALDIAKQFENRYAENILINEGHAP